MWTTLCATGEYAVIRRFREESKAGNDTDSQTFTRLLMRRLGGVCLDVQNRR
jgi:hypothetical protein